MAVAIPRDGTMKFIQDSDPGYISCNHGEYYNPGLTGAVRRFHLLEDDWKFEHQVLWELHTKVTS